VLQKKHSDAALLKYNCGAEDNLVVENVTAPKKTEMAQNMARDIKI
jgi:hypothetical protein